jgi:hypothetical protein
MMVRHAKEKSGHVVDDERKFCEGIQQMVDDALVKNYFEHIGDYIGIVCDLAYAHNVKLDPSYFRVAMALKVAEGVSLGEYAQYAITLISIIREYTICFRFEQRA